MFLEFKGSFNRNSTFFSDQAKPVYQSTGDKTRIIMNDLSEYQCNLQSVYPPSHGEWANENAKSLQVSQKSGINRSSHVSYFCVRIKLRTVLPRLKKIVYWYYNINVSL